MITYLLGASPMSEKNYFINESHPQEPVRSIRNSALGYTNHPNVKVSYASMKQYLADIERMIEEGKLSRRKNFIHRFVSEAERKSQIWQKQAFVILNCGISI